MTILIALDGVLRDGPRMVREGRILFDVFHQADRRIVVMADESVERAEHWLATSGIKGHSGVLGPSIAVDPDEPLRQRQISAARAMGRVDLVIDGDPETIRHCLEIEVPALLFAHPKSSKPGWRPDGNRRTWAEIVAQLDKKVEAQDEP